jgi:hypothetical protein
MNFVDLFYFFRKKAKESKERSHGKTPFTMITKKRLEKKYFYIKEMQLFSADATIFLTGGLYVISPKWKEPKWKCSTFCGLSWTTTNP